MKNKTVIEIVSHLVNFYIKKKSKKRKKDDYKSLPL